VIGPTLAVDHRQLRGTWLFFINIPGGYSLAGCLTSLTDTTTSLIWCRKSLGRISGGLNGLGPLALVGVRFEIVSTRGKRKRMILIELIVALASYGACLMVSGSGSWPEGSRRVMVIDFHVLKTAILHWPRPHAGR